MDLSVTNPVNGQGPGRSGGAHGIVGMRERAALLGGALQAGRSADEFRVQASIPYTGALR